MLFLIRIVLDPAFDVALFSPGNGQGLRRYVLRNRRACADIGVLADGDRRYEIAVAAYEGVVANRRAVLFLAVVVDRDSTASVRLT